MSIQKQSNLPQLSDTDQLILNKTKDVATEANLLQSDLFKPTSPYDCVCQSLDELTVLQEFRQSKFNYKIERLKQLKNKMSKSFQ